MSKEKNVYKFATKTCCNFRIFRREIFYLKYRKYEEISFPLQINGLAESKEFKKHSFFYECTVEYPTSVRS